MAGRTILVMVLNAFSMIYDTMKMLLVPSQELFSWPSKRLLHARTFSESQNAQHRGKIYSAKMG